MSGCSPWQIYSVEATLSGVGVACAIKESFSSGDGEEISAIGN